MVLPTLIGREMRSAARQPFSYHVRVLGAGTLLAVGIVAVAEGSGEWAKGGPLFARLHATLLVAIWCLVPLLTADCISRERREHTLPLLFLTLLKPWHIVLAKGMTHGLRAMTLWLFCASLIARDLEEWPSVLFFASTFLTLPVIGLYNSLARASFASAFVSTLVMGVVLPEFLAHVDEFVSFILLVLGHINGFHTSATPLRVIPFQLGVAAAFAWRLYRNLRRRAFALEQQVT